MSGERPSWQRDDCPPWCSRVHREDDHADDRAHVDDGEIVPVTVHEAEPSADGIVYVPRSLDLVVGRYRADGDDTTWYYIGDDERNGFQMTSESVGRLERVLRRLLTEDPTR